MTITPDKAKRRDKTRYALVGLVCYLTLFLPLVQMNFTLFKPLRLNNLHSPAPPGLPSWEQLASGEYQKKVSVWFLRRHGLWGHMVRLDNQINLELFNQISSKYKAALKVGRDKWLFQGLYLEHFNRINRADETILEARVAALKKLEQLLAQRGIGFLLIVSANKIEVHPELVPPQYHAPGRLQRVSEYQHFIDYLKKYEVTNFDTIQYFSERGAGRPRKYFTPAGSHWNDLGACEVADRIAAEIEFFTQQATRRIDCSEIYHLPKPKETDRDLLVMANLWSGERYMQPTPYPKAKLITPEQEAFRPNLLVVGSSFGWSVLRFLNHFRIQQDAEFWYYYKRSRHYPSKREYRIDRGRIDWQKRLFDRDYVVVEAKVAALSNAGFEFVEDAINALESKPVQ